MRAAAGMDFPVPSAITGNYQGKLGAGHRRTATENIQQTNNENERTEHPECSMPIL